MKHLAGERAAAGPARFFFHLGEVLHFYDTKLRKVGIDESAEILGKTLEWANGLLGKVLSDPQELDAWVGRINWMFRDVESRAFGDRPKISRMFVRDGEAVVVKLDYDLNGRPVTSRIEVRKTLAAWRGRLEFADRWFKAANFALALRDVCSDPNFTNVVSGMRASAEVAKAFNSVRELAPILSQAMAGVVWQQRF